MLSAFFSKSAINSTTITDKKTSITNQINYCQCKQKLAGTSLQFQTLASTSEVFSFYLDCTIYARCLQQPTLKLPSRTNQLCKRAKGLFLSDPTNTRNLNDARAPEIQNFVKHLILFQFAGSGRLGQFFNSFHESEMGGSKGWLESYTVAIFANFGNKSKGVKNPLQFQTIISKAF